MLEIFIFYTDILKHISTIKLFLSKSQINHDMTPNFPLNLKKILTIEVIITYKEKNSTQKFLKSNQASESPIQRVLIRVICLPQVKCHFDAMNFQHFLEMLEIMLHLI